jgi:dihydroorotate dehydrogenase electron transfer subunit
MKAVWAEVVSSDDAWPGVRRLVLRAPALVQDAAAGQFVAVACADPPLGGMPLLRRPLSIAGLARQPGDLVLLFEVRGRGTAWLARQPAGAQANLLGPIGRPAVVADTSRRALLIGRGVARLAPLLALAADLSTRGLAVTMLAGGATASSLPPATLLHPEVEYHVATADGSAGSRGDALDLVPPFLSWADQLYAGLPLAQYEPLLALIRHHTLRPRPGFAQALLAGEHTMVPCGTGACDGCAVRTRDGYRRLCRDGPAFDLRDLVGS